jgi:hypothetical protein
MDSLDLCLYWYDRPLTGQQYLERLTAFLLHLQSSYPWKATSLSSTCFARWPTSGRRPTALAAALPSTMCSINPWAMCASAGSRSYRMLRRLPTFPLVFCSVPLGSRLLIRRKGPAPPAGDEAAMQALIRLRHVLEPHGFLRNPPVGSQFERDAAGKLASISAD